MKFGSLCLVVFAACAHALIPRSLVTHCDEIFFALTRLNSITTTPSQSSTPSTTCIINIIPTMTPLIEPTCTYYEKIFVMTSFTDCHGCQLNTLDIGPGPEVLCGETTVVPCTETTVTSCSPSAGTT